MYLVACLQRFVNDACFEQESVSSYGGAVTYAFRDVRTIDSLPSLTCKLSGADEEKARQVVNDVRSGYDSASRWLDVFGADASQSSNEGIAKLVNSFFIMGCALAEGKILEEVSDVARQAREKGVVLQR
ncbi:hypothetical protein HZB03_02330 [Candidatus Woesearchaeota archaeon]|nr:hypothetical protein [Candidatus Woesearchaeota archaeon]